MLERTLVFVDTSYLLASFYNSWEIGARAQLEIDLPEVVKVLGGMIESQLGQPIQRQNWYDGIPDSGPHRYQRALRTCDGVQLRSGQLIEWGERRTQKAVDTRLVADMVVAALQRQVSDFVLVSGDADMIPGVMEASAAGLRVHLYGFGWDSMSSALRHACDTTTILDPREDFADSMQLEVLEGPIPPVIRTKPLGDAEPPEPPGPKTIPTPIAGTTTIPAPKPAEEAPATPTAAADCETPAVNEPERYASGAERAAAKAVTEAEAAEAAEAEAAAAAQPAPSPTPAQMPPTREDTSPVEEAVTEVTEAPESPEAPEEEAERRPTPKPSMMARKRKLRSRYVPLPNEVWATAGFQTPFDVGQQYATWWYENAATSEQRDQAHLLSGGGLPPEVDRPLLQFACETLHEYTLSESQRVNLRDGFHAGIRGVLINIHRDYRDY